jgi:hypothetical protein
MSIVVSSHVIGAVSSPGIFAQPAALPQPRPSRGVMTIITTIDLPGGPEAVTLVEPSSTRAWRQGT